MLPASSVASLLLGAALATSGPAPVLRLQDPSLVESSGLAVSARHDGVLWTHADGGTVAEVKAVDGAGETVATVTLAGIDPYDPEALAPGLDGDGRPALFLGDLGDNERRRPDVSVFLFTEPKVLADRTVEARWYRFTYPDGPHDAEALLVHPGSGRFLVVTKDVAGAGVYRAPRDPVTEDQGTNELERVADAPAFVTDGAYLPDGRLVLRTYSAVHVYDRVGHETGSEALPPQPQGESVAVDGDALLVGSEGRRSAVYRVAVPGPAPASSREPEPDGRLPLRSADDDGPWREAYLVVRAVALVVLLGGVIAYLLRHRRRR